MTSIKFTDKRKMSPQELRMNQSAQAKQLEKSRADAVEQEALLRQQQEIVDVANKAAEAARIQNAPKAETIRKVDSFRLSFIEEYEEDIAIKMIEDLLGFERPRTVGWWITVKIYTRDEDIKKFRNADGTETMLYMPETINAHDKYKSCAGLVLSIGPLAYKNEMFGGVPWCKVGDWVAIGRNSGPQFNYRGVPVTCVEDKHAYMILQDPSHITRD